MRDELMRDILWNFHSNKIDEGETEAAIIALFTGEYEGLVGAVEKATKWYFETSDMEVEIYPFMDEIKSKLDALGKVGG